ncbi:MAG: type II toxin-antitoxin system RelE/ParE family toxin [Thermodesulfobacteriota bacterium]
MSYTLSIRPEAESDVADAYHYYQGCRSGLGSDFLLCVEEALERIAKNPLTYQDIHNGVHRTMIHRFPYGVFYVITEYRIIVIAVMHAARDPNLWQSRA